MTRQVAASHPDRRTLIVSLAGSLGVSRSIVYSALSGWLRPMGKRRVDRAMGLFIQTGGQEGWIGQPGQRHEAINLAAAFGHRGPMTDEAKSSIVKSDQEVQPNFVLLTSLLHAAFLTNSSVDGSIKMCPWERFCAFALEPETKEVARDAHNHANINVTSPRHSMIQTPICLSLNDPATIFRQEKNQLKVDFMILRSSDSVALSPSVRSVAGCMRAISNGEPTSNVLRRHDAGREGIRYSSGNVVLACFFAIGFAPHR